MVDFYKHLSPEGKQVVDARRAKVRRDADPQLEPLPDDDWLASLEQLDDKHAPVEDAPVEEEFDAVRLDPERAGAPLAAPAAPLPPSPSPELEPEPDATPRQAARARQREKAEEARQLELVQADEQAAGLEVLKGTVRRIKFSGEDFFVIAELRVPGRDEDEGSVTIKGALAGITEWCDVCLRGKWTTNPRFGRQFDFAEGEVLLPSDTKGAEAFLAMHLPSVGPGRARKIVQAFGHGPEGIVGLWRMLEQEPERLTAIPGIREADLPDIREEYAKSRGLRDQEVWLRQLELGPKRTTRVLAAYRERTRATLEADPYVLMDVKGFGFKLADDVAKRIGVGNDHPGRARAALLHVLREAAEGEGHCYLPQQELLSRTDELAVPAARVLELIAQLAGADGGRRLVVDPPGPEGVGPERKVALTGLAEAERRVAEQIASRLQLPRGARPVAPVVPALAPVVPAPAAPEVQSSPAPRSEPRSEAVVKAWVEGFVQKVRAGGSASEALPPRPMTVAETVAAVPPAAHGPELDREKKLPPLSRRAWQRSGRAAAAANAPLPGVGSAVDPDSFGPAGALDAGTLAAALGVAPRRIGR